MRRPVFYHNMTCSRLSVYGSLNGAVLSFSLIQLSTYISGAVEIFALQFHYVRKGRAGEFLKLHC